MALTIDSPKADAVAARGALGAKSFERFEELIDCGCGDDWPAVGRCEQGPAAHGGRRDVDATAAHVVS
jgi:hypothetical protein